MDRSYSGNKQKADRARPHQAAPFLSVRMRLKGIKRLKKMEVGQEDWEMQRYEMGSEVCWSSKL